MGNTENDLYFIVALATVLLALVTGFIFAFVQIYKRRQLIYQNNLLRKEQIFAETLLRSRLEISENMMENISEELHDNIGQAMVSANLQLAAITAGNFTTQAETSRGILTRALQDLRNLSRTLNGQYIMAEGLQHALEQEVMLLQNSGKIESALAGDSLDRVLSQDAEIMVFRCIQESLSNALKHAVASQIVICSAMSEKEVTISITDNGRGMPVEPQQRNGLGLRNMRHRMELIGGDISIHSQAGKGTEIKLIVPLPYEPNQNAT